MNLTTRQSKFVASVMLVSCINFLTGCSYYMPVTVNAPTIEEKMASLKEFNSETKFFIVRKGDESYAMKDMVYNDSSMAIHAMLREVPKPHKLYIDAVSDHYTIPTHGWPEYDLYQEVHIFVGENTRLDTAQMFVLPLSAVEKIEVIQKDEERTKQNRTLAVVGISLAGAFLIVAFMVAVIDAFGEQY